MQKPRVLFVCIHNSARSQMAEALLRAHCGDKFDAHSAGIEPGKLNPLAVAAMKEIGIDIAKAATKSVFEMLKSSELFSYVITVCDETNAERCPVFPGPGQRLHWGFPDPSSFEGDWDERLRRTAEVRDVISKRIREWCAETTGHCDVSRGS